MQKLEPDTKFNPARLRLARNFNGWSQAELGERIGVSQVYVGYLESGRKQPGGLTTETIAEATGFDPSFFSEDILYEFKEENCHFRRRQTTPVSLRTRVLAKGTLLNQLVQFLETEVSLPKTKIPNLKAQTREDLERAAERCRMEWGLGRDLPIKSMMRVLENAGVIAVRLSENEEKIDAFSHSGDRPVVILNTAKQSPSRSRFDMAHECGHLVLHGSNIGKVEIEEEADSFASAFLLPRAGFIREFPRGSSIDWTAMYQLKTRWRTSFAAMFRRAYDLGLIGAVQYQRAYKQLAAKGWLKGEPGEFEHEEPETIRSAIQVLEEEGMERIDICKTMKWKPGVFEHITGLAILDQNISHKAGMVVSLDSCRPGI